MSRFLALILGLSYALIYMDGIRATLNTWGTPQWSAVGILAFSLILIYSFSTYNPKKP